MEHDGNGHELAYLERAASYLELAEQIQQMLAKAVHIANQTLHQPSEHAIMRTFQSMLDRTAISPMAYGAVPPILP